jgi:hypothetical protein
MKYVPLIGPIWWLIKYRGAATEELASDVEEKMWVDGWRVMWVFVSTIIMILIALVFLVRYFLTG